MSRTGMKLAQQREERGDQEKTSSSFPIQTFLRHKNGKNGKHFIKSFWNFTTTKEKNNNIKQAWTCEKWEGGENQELNRSESEA